MSKFTSTAIAALMFSSSTYAFAQVADRSYYSEATVAPTGGENFFVRNRYTAATDHVYEGVDPVPVRLGVFEARPVLLVSALSTSNVFLSDVVEESDIILAIEPSVSATTTWSRHRIGFDAAVRHEEFLDLSDQNATEYGVRGFGEVDVSSNFAVAGSLLHQNLRENRLGIGGQTTPANAERVEFDRSYGEVNAVYATDRIRLRGRIGVNELDYSNNASVPFNQDLRDQEAVTVSASAQYAVTRDWAIIGEVISVDRDYTDPASNRDITGITYRAGVNFELPVNLRGRITGQYQDFDPEDPTLQPIEGGGLDASVQWFPTELTTANFFASQSVSDAGNTVDSNVEVTRYGAGLDHELLRTLVLTSQVAFENRQFNPSNREDDLTVFNVGANWKLNPNVQIRGGYTYATQDSTINPFDDHTISVAIRFFP